ncbi:hypothetical protein DPMN_006246 [Dreissena polymorpha]|uniref:Uncharacterized protein n=1 Tax=Dreissena polymorpha TaxID=45954 RepID=A0A9D4MUW9_DREPO|nr:hypothetical protein DPMN_006246 [Dreissena polymorpha]
MLKLAQSNQPTDQPTDRAETISLYNITRVLTSGHVFQPTSIIFKLVKDIIGMNVLTKFHEDWTINLASREKCPAPWQPCFSSKATIFELIQDIIGTNHLSKFHEDWTINVDSRVLTRFYYNIIGINLLTKFHEDWAINVVSRINAPSLGSHVFQANVTIFELIQDIIKTNRLNKFHEDWTINANVDVAQRTTDKRRSQKLTMSTKFLPKFHEDWNMNIIGINILTKFQKDWTIFYLLMPHYSRRTKCNYKSSPLTGSAKTNRQTNRQGKNNMSPTTIVGDITKADSLA